MKRDGSKTCRRGVQTVYITKKNVVFLALVLLIISLSGTLGANGTESDPLISKSYLELRLKELKTEVDSLKKELAKQTPGDAVDEGQTGSERVFKPLRLDPGASIYFKEGTEFIMRVGEASIVDPTTNGLPNLTTGTNLMDGDNVPKNNLFISPREDGRGLACRIEVWLLIKGGYTLTQP